MRKHILLPLLILLFMGSCTNTDQSTKDPDPSASEPGRVFLANGKVSFVPPDGFRSLTAEEISREFPGKDAPRYVFSNATQAVSVRIGFSPARSTPDMLEELKAELEKSFPRMFPGLQWQDKTIVEIGGARWINLRFMSTQFDIELVNDMYITPFDGNLVIFGYNAEVDKWEASRQLIDVSKSSIRLRS